MSANMLVQPPQVSQATVETVPWEFDFTAVVGSGDVVSSPASTMTDMQTGSQVTLAQAPTVSGNLVTQVVPGSGLVAGHNYRLVVVAQLNPSKVLSLPLIVTVPY